ncbi:MAG: histidine kinase [Saprospiraceae bacterium]|nr:histidine kinase [Saprospiraceae bacterium]
MYYSFFLSQISAGRRGAERDLGELLIDATFHVFSMMAIAYLNYFYFFPRFLARKNLGRYLLEFSVPFGVLLAGVVGVKRYITDGYTYKTHFIYSQSFINYMIFNTLFIVLFVAMLKFVEDWFELEAQKKEIENEKLVAELRFLKAQINPHFLFNTLNNLYSLAFTNSPNTTVVIDKLSQMMRYMIYDSNHLKVSLTKEIDYMQNYISLEKLRLNNEVPISFKIMGNTEGVKIVPLILITFLENAFKHGISNNAKMAWINITLELSGNACVYTVENSKLPEKDEKTKEKSGIGLQNVQRRLELSYPNQYDLEVEDNQNHYLVQLNLDLS